LTDLDLLIFVDEATAVNNAVERARLFNESVPIGGSILTKTDADAMGGSAISIAYITGKPVLFLGIGQDYPTWSSSSQSGLWTGCWANPKHKFSNSKTYAGIPGIRLVIQQPTFRASHQIIRK